VERLAALPEEQSIPLLPIPSVVESQRDAFVEIQL
jgi:hypothetical protein